MRAPPCATKDLASQPCWLQSTPSLTLSPRQVDKLWSIVPIYYVW